MKKLLTLDAQNYPDGLEELRRTAVRGIIFIGGKLLMVHTSYGEVKFPGGGQEPGEDDLQTLVREVEEETGFTVISGSVREFGSIEEKRLSVHENENLIWHPTSNYYFCDVEETPGECRYTENEQKLGFYVVFVTVDEAIELNRACAESEHSSPWAQREYNALMLLRQHMEKA